MNDLPKIIGQRLRNYRVQQKISQEKLAERAGCHPTYIGQIERGEKNATIESIAKIAAALKISLSELFEKLGDGEDTGSIAFQCYLFLSEKSESEQAQLYQVLLDLDRYKNQ